ncbi:MAG: hypothetical protein ACR2KV_10610 [Solirubrobacteraceae bacterium]
MSTPTDQLGVPGLFAASEVTPEGSIYTGYGELAFAFGSPLAPYLAPHRSLVEGGGYPIIGSGIARGGVGYRVTMLAAPVDGVAVDFLRVRMRNLTRGRRTAVWAVGVRASGDGRLTRQGAPYFRYLAPSGTPNGFYAQPGEAWQPGRRWAVSGDAIVREAADGSRPVFALLPPARGRRIDGDRACARRTTICVRVAYARALAPGAAAELVFKLPAVPVVHPSAALVGTGWTEAHTSVRRAFDAALGAGMRVRLPEPAVADAYRASLVQILTSRYRLPGGAWVQAVNDLQYHAFWLRDAAIMTNALDLAGLHAPAGEDLDYFAAWQHPDGLFMSRAGQYDGMGQALWAIGRHAELTGDAAYAAAELPAVGRAVAWLDAELTGDPLGLLPAGDPGDNEFLAGHLAGDDFWAVAGLDAAVDLAGRAGRPDLAAAWRPLAERLRGSAAAATRTAAARHGGAVPPALDRPGGRDWGNWWVAYPDGPLAPGDPAVTATIRRARAGFRQGIATYAGQLHDYTGFRIFETELARGDQAAVIDGLYSELAHATGTLGGFETDIRPGGKRSSASNLTPHGTYSAELVTLIRNMLVRDGPAGVVLLGAVPGAWLLPGQTVSVARAPTRRGAVSFTLRSGAGGATLAWSAPAGTSLAWPVPAGVRGFRAGAGRVERGVLVLPGSSGSLAVRWTPRRGLTLAEAVAHLRRAVG